MDKKRPRDKGKSSKKSGSDKGRPHKKHKSSHGHSKKGASSSSGRGMPVTAKTLIPAVGDVQAAAKKKQQSEFLCEVEYRNTLPDPPFDPKFRRFKLNPERLYRYRAALDRTYKWDILVERDLGIPLDVLDTDQYMKRDGAPNEMQPGDLALFPESLTGDRRAARKSIQDVRRQGLNWMRKPDYITNNPYEGTTRQTSLAAKNREDNLRLETARASSQIVDVRGQEIEAIEETFRLAKQQPRHPEDPSARPESVQELFPDDTSALDFTLVQFENDPRFVGQEVKLPPQFSNKPLMSILKSEGEQHYGYYRPTQLEELPPHSSQNPPSGSVAAPGKPPQSFKHVQEYSRKPTPSVALDNNFFIIRDPAKPHLTYARYPHRLNLKKRTKTRGDDPAADLRARAPSVTLHYAAGEPAQVAADNAAWRSDLNRAAAQRARERELARRAEERERARAEEEGEASSEGKAPRRSGSGAASSSSAAIEAIEAEPVDPEAALPENLLEEGAEENAGEAAAEGGEAAMEAAEGGEAAPAAEGEAEADGGAAAAAGGGEEAAQTPVLPTDEAAAAGDAAGEAATAAAAADSGAAAMDSSADGAGSGQAS